MAAEETVTVSGDTFTVRELTIGQMLPILPRLTGDDVYSAQLDLLKLSVARDGALLGDAVADLPVSCLMPLITKTLELNGMSEGNG